MSTTIMFHLRTILYYISLPKFGLGKKSVIFRTALFDFTVNQNTIDVTRNNILGKLLKLQTFYYERFLAGTCIFYTFLGGYIIWFEG